MKARPHGWRFKCSDRLWAVNRTEMRKQRTGLPPFALRTAGLVQEAPCHPGSFGMPRNWKRGLRGSQSLSLSPAGWPSDTFPRQFILLRSSKGQLSALGASGLRPSMGHWLPAPPAAADLVRALGLSWWGRHIPPHPRGCALCFGAMEHPWSTGPLCSFPASALFYLILSENSGSL